MSPVENHRDTLSVAQTSVFGKAPKYWSLTFTLSVTTRKDNESSNRRLRWSQEPTRAWSHTLSPEQRSEQKRLIQANRGPQQRRRRAATVSPRWHWRPQTLSATDEWYHTSGRDCSRPGCALVVKVSHLVWGGWDKELLCVPQWETDREDKGLQQIPSERTWSCL